MWWLQNQYRTVVQYSMCNFRLQFKVLKSCGTPADYIPVQGEQLVSRSAVDLTILEACPDHQSSDPSLAVFP